MYLYIAIAIVILVLALLMSHIKLLSRVSLIDGQFETVLLLSLWGIRWSLLKKKEDKSKEDHDTVQKESMNKIKWSFDVFYDAFKILKTSLHVTLFSFKARLGTQDAADTGIATGVAYSVIYNILNLIDKTFDLKEHTVSITPVFNDECFDFEFESRVKLRLIHCLRIIKVLTKLKG